MVDVFAVELTVYEPRELRFRPRSSTDGKPIVRMGDKALEALLLKDHAEPWSRYLVTGEVEGILVRGGADFEYDAERKCARSVKAMNDTGRGEDVTLVSNLVGFIPDANKPKSIANAQPSDKALKVLALLETGVGPF